MFQVLTDSLAGLITGAGRAMQTTFLNQGHWIIQSVRGDVLRVYAQIVQPFTDILKAVINATEFQRESAVSIVWDKATKRVLLVEITRPVIPVEHIDAWRASWATHIEGPQRDVEAFAREMAAILGDTHWQLTQSYSYPPETILDTARRAAEDQGGMQAIAFERLGVGYTDSSNRADFVSYYLVTVDIAQEPVRWKTMANRPKLNANLWVTEAEFLALVKTEKHGIPTGFAHTAYAFMKAHGIW